jgi:hypothetical protein
LFEPLVGVELTLFEVNLATPMSSGVIAGLA